jgi:hypothetical protein
METRVLRFGRKHDPATGYRDLVVRSSDSD